MITRKQFMLLFCVFLFAVVSYQSQPVDALPFDYEYTDEVVSAGSYSYVSFELTSGDTLSGYFETADDSQGLDFFICNDYNFGEWVAGHSATAYEIESNMHTNGFSLSIPSTDTWHVVLDNTDGSTAVTVDLAVDINGDNTPYYSTSSYDYTGYAEILENDEYYYEDLYLYEGTVIDGHFSTFFASDGLDFFICDEDNFDDWELGYSATGYSIETEMHTATIDTFEIPYTDTWYLVWYAESEVDTLTFSYGFDIDTSGVGGGGVIDDGIGIGFTFIGLGAALLICLILCCVCRSKKKEPEVRPPTVQHYMPPPTQPHTTTVKEREIVRDRVLVICPYCGAKNEQGVMNCYNCDAEL